MHLPEIRAGERERDRHRRFHAQNSFAQMREREAVAFETAAATPAAKEACAAFLEGRKPNLD